MMLAFSRVICPVLVTCSAAYLLLLLSGAKVDAQTYHYSNGWYPGKKRSEMASGALQAAGRLRQDACAFRPEMVKAIHSLIQKEISRLQRSCVFENSLSLKDILQTELLQQTADPTSIQKLDEESDDSTKW